MVFTTVEEALAALRVYDERHWRHAIGLPTNVQAYMRLQNDLPQVCASHDEIMLAAGVILEQVFRLGNASEYSPGIYEVAVSAATRSQYSPLFYLPNGGEVGWRPHVMIEKDMRELNAVLVEWMEQDPTSHHGVRIARAMRGLMQVATIAVAVRKERPEGVTLVDALEAFHLRLTALYAVYGETIPA